MLCHYDILTPPRAPQLDNAYIMYYYTHTITLISKGEIMKIITKTLKIVFWFITLSLIGFILIPLIFARSIPNDIEFSGLD